MLPAVQSPITNHQSPIINHQSTINNRQSQIANRFSFVVLLIFLLAQMAWAQGSLMLVGGGGENYNSWSDAPYGWFVAQADSGKIINIDTGTASDWYPGYFKSLGAADESHALQIPASQANAQTIYEELLSAQGIFMEGGDQWDYVSAWKGTLVAEAIDSVFRRGGAIGGTSAGLAVLGEAVFDAKFGSAYPDDVAYNPYHFKIHFELDFLHLLPGVITDSHFHSRGRMGRLVPFLARLISEEERPFTGIGVADKTAFCLDPQRIGRVWGYGTVTILYPTALSQIECSAGISPTFTHIGFDQLIEGTVYDLENLTLVEGGEFLQNVTPSDPPQQFSQIEISGSDEASANEGSVVITRLTSNALNAWYGNLNMSTGSGALPNSVIMPRLWSNDDYYENRWVGAMYGVATYPGYMALWLDDPSQVSVSADGLFHTDSGPAYILDTQTMSHVGFHGDINTNYCAIIGGKLHFLGEGKTFDLMTMSPVTKLQEPIPPEFFQISAAPNPFNSQTRISLEIPRAGDVEIFICDLSGRLILQKKLSNLPAGSFSFFWNGENLSSGLYLLSAKTAQHSQNIKLILLK
jgi:cyanophycinase